MQGSAERERISQNSNDYGKDQIIHFIVDSYGYNISNCKTIIEKQELYLLFPEIINNNCYITNNITNT